jgi:putative ABC transport system substrate-binding protein
MDRRAFVASTLVLLTVPLAAQAQPVAKMPHVGVLFIASPEHHPLARAAFDNFRKGLRERGYVDGQNIIIEPRFQSEKREPYQDLVAELVHLRVDAIVVTSTPMALAAKEVTRTIPLVAVVMADPVRDGIVASLARPGGNITGLTFLGPALTAKRLQLLRDVVPGAARVAVLFHPGVYGEHTMRDMVEEAQGAAKTLALRLQFVEAKRPDELASAFSVMTTGGANAMTLFPSPMFYAEQRRLVDLAVTHRLPVIYSFREAVDLGGLMSYGTYIPDLFRQAATFVDKILKGAKPADLPVQQPTKFDLVINLKTAKALGLTIPQSVLLQADDVIQ